MPKFHDKDTSVKDLPKREESNGFGITHPVAKDPTLTPEENKLKNDNIPTKLVVDPSDVGRPVEDVPSGLEVKRMSLLKKLEDAQAGRLISEIPLSDEYYAVRAELNKAESELKA